MAGKNVIELTDANFEAEVLKSDVPDGCNCSAIRRRTCISMARRKPGRDAKLVTSPACIARPCTLRGVYESSRNYPCSGARIQWSDRE